MDPQTSATLLPPPQAAECRALVVDGDGSCRTTTSRVLSEYGIETIQASSGEEALRIAREDPRGVGVILLDLMTPKSGGYEVLGRLKHVPDLSSIPVLLLAEQSHDDDMVRGIENGADDLLSKPLKGPVLVAKVRALLQRRRAELLLRDRLKRAEELATTDALTGLANLREFQGELLREISYTRRHSEPFALLLVDVDHFKVINDRYGHPQGDEVLIQLTQRIRETMRASDQAFRIGGDEFGVLLRGADRSRAYNAAERLVNAAQGEPVRLTSGEELAVTISVGVASADEDNEFDAQGLINRADSTLYRAKRAGRNCAELEPELETQAKVAPY